jgi:hypothetical protein
MEWRIFLSCPPHLPQCGWNNQWTYITKEENTFFRTQNPMVQSSGVINFTPLPIYSEGKSPDINWRGGWMDPRAGPNHYRDSNRDSSVVQLLGCRYTDCATLARPGLVNLSNLLFIAYNHASLHRYHVFVPLHTQIRASVVAVSVSVYTGLSFGTDYRSGWPRRESGLSGHSGLQWL